ncbi:MAG: hypothetical protein QOE90_647 [Thermoplasmata archaeon]|jgi:hypothetical protein|nr:hypothetical protein [Thermoplasmata archaeon]
MPAKTLLDLDMPHDLLLYWARRKLESRDRDLT